MTRAVASCDVATSSHDVMRSCDVVTSSSEVITSRDVTTPSPNLISGMSISVQRSDLPSIRSKEKFIQQRRHSTCTSLTEFTSQGFVPFLPEGLLKKGAPPSNVLSRTVSASSVLSRAPRGGAVESRDYDVTSTQALSSEPSDPYRKKRFTDEEIDLLSYLYSNNFDPTRCSTNTGQDVKYTVKNPEKSAHKQTNRQEILAERLGVKNIGILAEEEGDCSEKISRSDSYAKNGRRYSSIN